MALLKIQTYGNQLLAIFDDGARVLAYPTGNDMWYVSGEGGGPGPDPDPSGDFVWPFNPAPMSEGGDVSSEYGPRSGGTGTFHEGIDFGVAAGTDIPAIGAGTVVENYFHANFGNFLIIQHAETGGLDLYSDYAHMQSASPLAVGTAVNTGDIVGQVGNTGASQGAHLRMEIHRPEVGQPIVWNTANDGGYRTAVNPRDFMAEYGTPWGS